MPLSGVQLRAAVSQVCRSLQRETIGPGDRVGLVIQPGVELAVGLLGCMASAVAAPLNPASSEIGFYDDLERLGVKAVLVDAVPPPDLLRALDRLALPMLRLPLQGRTPPADSGEDSLVPCSRGSSEEALVLQTSGTTARPKVVPLTQANLLHSARNIARVLDLQPDDRCLSAMPLFHIHGIVACLLAPLLSGGTVLCCRRNDPQHVLSLLASGRPTWLSAVPTLLQALLKASDRTNRAQPGRPQPIHSLRFIRSSSSPLPPAVLQALEDTFQVPVIEAYGMTEAAHQICSNRLPPAPRSPGSVGAAAGPEVAVLDSSHRPLPPGETGEVAIRGDNVTRGYETAASGWVGTEPQERWFLTGDEGFLDEQDFLHLTGRLKEMINRGGEKIIPRQIDEALLAHPAVEQAVAFALPHPSLGEDLAAAVVMANGGDALEEELRRHCFGCLAPHQVPSRILLLDDLPKGPTGKLQRIGMADRLSDVLRQAHSPPEGELETLICTTIARVLGRGEPGRNDNFFFSGGDSLSGQQVMARLEIELSLALPATLLFVHPTPRLLATDLDQRLDQAIAALAEREQATLKP